jgi:hypothetical protein
MMEQTLTADNVDQLFRACLYSEDEVKDGQAPDDAIVVEGIVLKVGFHPGRVTENKEVIRKLVKQLPDEFHKTKGGGMSFLNMCVDREGNQWTGEHRVMEQLTCLAIAAKLGDYCMSRDMWTAMPGGVPYIMFDPEA